MSLLVTTSPLQSGLPFLSIQAESTTWQLNFTSEHTKLARMFQWMNTESVAPKPNAYTFFELEESQSVMNELFTFILELSAF